MFSSRREVKGWIGCSQDYVQSFGWNEPQFLICLPPFLRVPMDFGTFAWFSLPEDDTRYYLGPTSPIGQVLFLVQPNAEQQLQEAVLVSQEHTSRWGYSCILHR